MRPLRIPGAATVWLLALAAGAMAQTTPKAHTLDRPDGTFAEPFSDISGLRQLADGRLIVADRLEKAVRVVDFDAGSYDEVGRVGSGPGEFQIPGRLLPLPGDSTLLVDFGNNRLSVLGPDGRVRRSTSMQQTFKGADGGTGMTLVMPEVTDASGSIYFDMMGSFTMGPDGPPDSSAIVRWTLDSERYDTVAMLPNPMAGGATMRAGGSGGGFSFTSLGGGPLHPRPGWSVAPNGTVALAWPDPYHLETVRRDGRRQAGPAIPYRPVPVTEADKQAWADGMAGGAMMVVSGSSSSSGGSRSFTMPRPDPDGQEWPEVKPPFRPRGVTAAADNRVWVQRFVKAGAPEMYDVFDERGTLVERVTLPAGRTLIGFGPGVVYLVNTDEDDLQWLERYRI